jgi:hypothetical protein
MRATQQICRPKPNPKKIIRKPNLVGKNKNFSKKTVFRTLKVERSQKFVLWDGICRLDSKS